jgi:lipoprotein-releasing system permease protein
MLSLKIAWRFLKSSPAQSILIITGISVGIATQIFVGSIIVSLQANLLNTTIGSAAHVTIKAVKEADPVRFTPEMQKLVYEDKRVRPGSVMPVRSVSALFTNGTDSSSLGVLGGELRQFDGIFKLSSHITAGKSSLGTGEIMIGKDFAEKFGVRVGDTISMTFQDNSSASFKVTGIFDLGSAQFNLRNAFVAANVPRSILGWRSDEFSSIQVQLLQPYDSKTVARQWASQLPGVSVIEWQSQNADLLSGLVAQSVSSYMIQAFVLVAVALGIASTLAIAAVQKTRQIGILKAMGLADRPASLVFMWQAALLGLSGSAGGVLASIGLLWLFRLSPAPFTITMQPGFVAASALIGVVVALLSSVIPIRSTSRLDPIEVIQNG